MLLGADRVGKSTAIDQLQKHFYVHQKYYGDPVIKKFHFSGPEAWHDSPIDQYTLPLLANLNQYQDKPCVFLCDRGGPEVCFYEKFRRHVDIPRHYLTQFEDFLLDNFLHIHVYLIYAPWWEVEGRHVEEIEQQHPECSDYFRSMQLEGRKNEHEAYYDYMFKELSNSQCALKIEYVSNSNQIVSQLESLIDASHYYD